MSLALLTLVVLALISTVPAEAVYNVHSDGTATVIVTMETINRLYVSLRIEGENVENLIAFDQEGSPLPIDFNDSIVTVYTLNSTRASIVFNVKFAFQDGVTWSSHLETNIPTVIVLPEGSGVTEYSEGGEVDVVDGRLAVKFSSPGTHTLQYIYLPETLNYTLTTPLPPSATTSPASPTPTTPPTPTLFRVEHLLVLLAVVASLGLLGLYFFKKRRESIEESLVFSEEITDERDKAILEALEKYGRLTLADLSKVAGLHKSTVWRRVRKLKELGYVKVKRVSGKTIVEKKDVERV